MLRLLCITSSSLRVQHPDDGSITNSWHFTGGEAQLEAAGPSSGAPDESELVLSVRKDARVRLRVLGMRHMAQGSGS